MRGFYVRAPFPVIARLDATVAHVADALAAQGHPGTTDELRVLAVLVLANPVEAVRVLSAYHHANTQTAEDVGVSTGAPSLALGHCSTTEGGGDIDVERLPLPAGRCRSTTPCPTTGTARQASRGSGTTAP